MVKISVTHYMQSFDLMIQLWKRFFYLSFCRQLTRTEQVDEPSICQTSDPPLHWPWRKMYNSAVDVFPSVFSFHTDSSRLSASVWFLWKRSISDFNLSATQQEKCSVFLFSTLKFKHFVAFICQFCSNPYNVLNKLCLLFLGANIWIYNNFSWSSDLT